MLIRNLPIEKRKFIHSLIFPTLFVLVLWIVKLAEYVMNSSFADFGVYPMKLSGSIGIITSPLIHGDLQHLFANTIPLFTLGTGLFYFYRKVSYQVFFLIYLLTGLSVWFAGREAFHIGASGVLYGLASFIFFSGVIRRDIRLLAISLLVVFLYGSMVWGIFPLKPGVSWESHLFGGISGFVLSIFYRNFGPKPVKLAWQEEYDDEEDDEKSRESDDSEKLKNEPDTHITKQPKYTPPVSTNGNSIHYDFND